MSATPSAELAERVEAAEGPSYALDCAIGEYVAKATGAPYIVPPKPYTASMDAAATLRPDGWFFFVDSNTPVATVYLPSILHTRLTKAHGAGATPALAICAAALRARAGEVG